MSYVNTMRNVVCSLGVVCVLATPALAQEGDETAEGLDLLREGSRLILEGLLEDIRPMIEETRPLLEDELVPFLENLGALIDDLSAYEMPERLENGDIIIRRSPDRPLPEPDATEDMPEDAVEL